MTLALTGAIGLATGTANRDINAEFGLANNAVFPTAFYGKGGAPPSGPLSFSDFYGRSNVTVAVATASPDPMDFGDTVSPMTGGNMDCNVTGGVGPFLYAWARVSGDANLSATSPAAASSAVTATLMGGVGTIRTAQFQCSVTDTGNGSIISLSNVITVNAERF